MKRLLSALITGAIIVVGANGIAQETDKNDQPNNEMMKKKEHHEMMMKKKEHHKKEHHEEMTKKKEHHKKHKKDMMKDDKEQSMNEPNKNTPQEPGASDESTSNTPGDAKTQE